MEDNKKPYHHGNLRQSLIDQATVMIGEAGVENLSMRNLAQVAGVSRTAAYHHFKDKNELLCAIAEQGFRHWQVWFAELMEEIPDSLERWLTRFVGHYIDFACEYREEYDLMFGRPIWRSGQPTYSLHEAAMECFNGYIDFIGKWQQEGIIPESVDSLKWAQASWSTLHGICRLLNDGVYLEKSSVSAMSGTVVNMLLHSLTQADSADQQY